MTRIRAHMKENFLFNHFMVDPHLRAECRAFCKAFAYAIFFVHFDILKKGSVQQLHWLALPVLDRQRQQLSGKWLDCRY